MKIDTSYLETSQVSRGLKTPLVFCYYEKSLFLPGFPELWNWIWDCSYLCPTYVWYFTPLLKLLPCSMLCSKNLLYVHFSRVLFNSCYLSRTSLVCVLMFLLKWVGKDSSDFSERRYAMIGARAQKITIQQRQRPTFTCTCHRYVLL